MAQRGNHALHDIAAEFSFANGLDGIVREMRAQRCFKCGCGGMPSKELVGKSIDCKLKPGWRYDEKRAVFVGPKGEALTPASLPKGARIVYKVPNLSSSSRRSLSPAERDLSRYLQVILPTGRGVEKLVPLVQSWPAIEEAHVTPQISLP